MDDIQHQILMFQKEVIKDHSLHQAIRKNLKTSADHSFEAISRVSDMS